MKNNWQPLESDLAWANQLIASLKLGGVWGCPAGLSITTKVTSADLTFCGPLYDDDSILEAAPPHAVESILKVNRRIILVFRQLGFNITHPVTKQPITTNPEWDLT